MTSSCPGSFQAPINDGAIMHLPIDIMREIFLQCSIKPCPLPPRPKEPRLVLTHVCSAWREVTLDMPRLWTNIFVDLDCPSFHAHGHSIISAWLSRSSPCPISLRIDHPVGEHGLFKSVILPMLHRCRRIVVGTSGAEFWQLLSLPIGTFSELEEIQIDGFEHSLEAAVMNPINHEQITTFQACPNLRRVSFSIHLRNLIDPRHLNLPWGGLSVLYIGWWITSRSGLDILRECTVLQECTLILFPIDNIDVDELTAVSRRPLLLSSLHSLTLGLVNHYALFLSTLHLPNLHTFYPAGQWDGFRWSPLSLRSFLQLNTLHLSIHCTVAGDDFWELIHPLRWLSEIHLSPSPLSSAHLREIGSGALIPSVTSINFGTAISIKELIPTLEERLAASRAVGSGISMFVLVSSGWVCPNDSRLIARLEALEAAGVQMEFGPLSVG